MPTRYMSNGPSRFTQYGGVAGADLALKQLVAERLAAQMEAEKQQQAQQQLHIENQMRQRQLSQGDERIGLEREGLRLQAQPRPPSPVTLSPGQRLVNPAGGGTIAEVPDRAAPPERPIALSPGARLISPSTGTLIASAPERSTAAESQKEWVIRDGQQVHDIPRPGDQRAPRESSTSETAVDRQRTARTNAARGFLTKLNELRERINTKMGPAAGLTGMVRQGAAAIGMDPDVAEYERERAAAGRALAVAIMGAQNLSDQDAAAWANMLPGARVDRETAARLMKQVETMLGGMGDPNPNAPSAQPVDNDPLGIRGGQK